MRLSKNTTLFLIILGELVIILLLLFRLFNLVRQNDPSLSFLKQEFFSQSSKSQYQYFYEPKEDMEWYDPKIPWMNRTEKDLKISINSDGLRERFDYSVEKPKDTFRIIALGNSFTFGLFVPLEDVYTELLEDALNNQKCKIPKKFEVINFGVPGYDVAFSTERFKIRGAKYNPDLIIFLTIENDFKYITNMNRILFSNKKIDPYLKNDEYFEAMNAKKKKYDVLAKRYGKDYVFRYQMDALKDLIRLYKKKILIATFDKLVAPGEININPVLKSLRDDKNVYFYGIPDSLLEDGGRYPDWHPNKKGHKIIATELFNFMNREKLIQCNK